MSFKYESAGEGGSVVCSRLPWSWRIQGERRETKQSLVSRARSAEPGQGELGREFEFISKYDEKGE